MIPAGYHVRAVTSRSWRAGCGQSGESSLWRRSAAGIARYLQANLAGEIRGEARWRIFATVCACKRADSVKRTAFRSEVRTRRQQCAGPAADPIVASQRMPNSPM